MKLTLLLLAAFACAASARSLKETASSTTEQQLILTPEQELAKQFDLWNAALQTGNPETVADMYADDAVLLPTISNTPRTDRASRVAYFKDFLTKKPFGTINDNHVRCLDDQCDTGINSGIYTFQTKDGTVQARYTFAYKKVDGEYKITEHHSSAMPEPVPSQEEKLAEVAALFDEWNAALQTLDPEVVASLYADDAVLLPTVSNLPRPDRMTKVDYFEYFLKLRPNGTIDDSNVRFLNGREDVAINSGIYTFDLLYPEGPKKVQARYTFIYKKTAGEWKIVEHHSSAMPEK